MDAYKRVYSLTRSLLFLLYLRSRARDKSRELPCTLVFINAAPRCKSGDISSRAFLEIFAVNGESPGEADKSLSFRHTSLLHVAYGFNIISD